MHTALKMPKSILLNVWVDERLPQSLKSTFRAIQFHLKKMRKS